MAAPIIAGLMAVHGAAAAPLPTTPEVIGSTCTAALEADDKLALQALQRQLLRPQPQPESLAQVLVRARALLVCRAPDGALQVLDRISPAPGEERRSWLLLRWQAAAAGLNHTVAADALVRLAEGDLARLEGLELEVSQGKAGTVRRSALDLLADHLEGLGWPNRAAAALLSGRSEGPSGAARLGRAVALASALPMAQRQALLERALEQAAVAGAWGLVAQLLDQQWQGTPELSASDMAVVRRLRLSGRIDDAYGEWRLRRRLALPQPRLEELERQLASPQAAGGHGAPTVSYPVP